jgi:hypothetical protein
MPALLPARSPLPMLSPKWAPPPPLPQRRPPPSPTGHFHRPGVSAPGRQPGGRAKASVAGPARPDLPRPGVGGAHGGPPPRPGRRHGADFSVSVQQQVSLVTWLGMPGRACDSLLLSRGTRLQRGAGAGLLMPQGYAAAPPLPPPPLLTPPPPTPKYTPPCPPGVQAERPHPRRVGRPEAPADPDPDLQPADGQHPGRLGRPGRQRWQRPARAAVAGAAGQRGPHRLHTPAAAGCGAAARGGGGWRGGQQGHRGHRRGGGVRMTCARPG